MGLSKRKAQEVGEGLKGRSFCGEKPEVSLRGAGDWAANPKAMCVTEDCWGEKLPVLCLDIPEHVQAWNTRAQLSV